mmetsp:Transcript_2501/g.2798  ORF Transcript_2501/g.2798 Transcript_2501/m.2798 type:complete len:105 (-) Transcript_2501:100-414(-)
MSILIQATALSHKILSPYHQLEKNPTKNPSNPPSSRPSREEFKEIFPIIRISIHAYLPPIQNTSISINSTSKFQQKFLSTTILYHQSKYNITKYIEYPKEKLII